MRKTVAWIVPVLTVALAAGAIISCQGRRTFDLAEEDTGKWYYGQPLYEVYTRAFSSEGTFKQLEAELPRLKEQGIGNIWLMPVHPIGEEGRKGSAGCPLLGP